MWYQFNINGTPYEQIDIIKNLKNWITELEVQDIIEGFAYNHYHGDSIEDHVAIRFDCSEENVNKIKNELKEKNIKVNTVHPWGGESQVLQAYEVGARCAFLIFDLIEIGRIPKEYIDPFLVGNEINNKSFEFQQHFLHGLCNSLAINKIPNEQILHLMSLLESTHTKNIHEFYEQNKESLLSQFSFV